MIKYAKIIDEVTGLVQIGLGTDLEFYKSIGMVECDVEQSDVDNNWYLSEKCPHKSEEEKERDERERINSLRITKRIFAMWLQQIGITYLQLKELIATNEQAQLEWDLCVELERKNPLLNEMAQRMGISSEQIDYIFKKANDELIAEES